MPSRRVFRLKARVEPLSRVQWMFFLAADVAGFERACADSGAEFFVLYYMDGWRQCFAAHGEEIEAEWRKRGWTSKQKSFVLQVYADRDYRLPHDIERTARARNGTRTQRNEEEKNHGNQ